MKKFIAFIMVCFCILIGSTTASATTYKYGVALSSTEVKVEPGKSYTIYATSNNKSGITFYDYAPEGNCVKISSQGKVKGTNNKYYCTVKSFSGTSGDYIGAINNYYKNGNDSVKYDSKKSSFCVFRFKHNYTIKTTNCNGSISLGVGEKYILNTSVNPSGYSPNYYTNNSSIVSCSSSNISGKKIGSATVTVSVDYQKSTAKVNVKKAPTAIYIKKLGDKSNLTGKSITLKCGKSLSVYECTSSGSYANAKNITYSSSNKSVATVNKKSVKSGEAIIKGIKTGSAKITVKTYNGKTATVTIKVI